MAIENHNQEEEKKDFAPDSIGVCWRESDGTVVLHLRAQAGDGTIGSAILRYPPDHPEYAEICAHLGPLLIDGEKKPVPPWPE